MKSIYNSNWKQLKSDPTYQALNKAIDILLAGLNNGARFDIIDPQLKRLQEIRRNYFDNNIKREGFLHEASLAHIF